MSLVLQRNNADAACWVGKWRVMIAYKARRLDAMVMPTIGDLLVPVSAGTVRGPRFAKLLQSPKERVATRTLAAAPVNRLDHRPVSANKNGAEACNVVVNIYSRTRLRVDLSPRGALFEAGTALAIDVKTDVFQGNITLFRTLGRMIAPARDLPDTVSSMTKNKIPREARIEGAETPYDAAKVLALLERRSPGMARRRDEELQLVAHGGDVHAHIEKTPIAGPYHVSVYVDGEYCPEHGQGAAHDHGHQGSSHQPAAAHAHPGDGGICGPGCTPERFIRILSTMSALPPAGTAAKIAAAAKRGTKRLGADTRKSKRR